LFEEQGNRLDGKRVRELDFDETDEHSAKSKIFYFSQMPKFSLSKRHHLDHSVTNFES
jgi:hypothetical protein